eukprot:3315409-Amphidinium_carterae.1
METIMKDIQVQQWWQYEDDITMFSESAVKEAMNKELSQLLSKQSLREIGSRSLTAEQLQQVVATRWVITQRRTNNGTKDIKRRFCGKGFSQFIHDTDTQTFAATPSSMAMRLLLTIAIIKQFAVFTADVASAFLNTPIDEEVIVQPPKEYCHNQPHTLWKMTKALYGLRTSPKQWQEHLSTILQKLDSQDSRMMCVCVFANKQSSIYLMAYVDDLLVVGDNVATQQFLQQFQQHLELKHTTLQSTQLTMPTSLEFLGKTIELMDNDTINPSFSAQYYNRILKAYNLEKCKASTVPGNKKTPIAAEPLDKVQHSMYRTAVRQLRWVSQLRVDIAFAVKELSRSLQQPDNEDLKNLKQLLRYIKGTTHYKVTLAPKASYNEKMRCRSTLSRLPTVIGLDAILQRGAQVVQSHRAGEKAGHSLQLLFPLQKLNSTQWDRQQ